MASRGLEIDFETEEILQHRDRVLGIKQITIEIAEHFGVEE